MKLWKFLVKLILKGRFSAIRGGHCTVCSRSTFFLLLGSPETIRNHALCVRCASCSRNRHTALCMVGGGVDHATIRLNEYAASGARRIHLASSQGPIAERMAGPANVICTEYFDDVKPGESKQGVLCQDLERLTFPDNHLDLIVTEDVFEHLRDYRDGFREVCRVLKPGGRHVFTIPYRFDKTTEDLWESRAGQRVLKEPIEYHGDPIRGAIPAWTRFGYDLLPYLESLGMEVVLRISNDVESRRFGTFDCFTFVARKK